MLPFSKIPALAKEILCAFRILPLLCVFKNSSRKSIDFLVLGCVCLPPEAAGALIQRAEATEQQENCRKDEKPLLLTPNCTVSQVGPGCWGAGEPREPGGTGATGDRSGGQLPPPAPSPSIPSAGSPPPTSETSAPAVLHAECTAWPGGRGQCKQPWARSGERPRAQWRNRASGHR